MKRCHIKTNLSTRWWASWVGRMWMWVLVGSNVLFKWSNFMQLCLLSEPTLLFQEKSWNRFFTQTCFFFKRFHHVEMLISSFLTASASNELSLDIKVNKPVTSDVSRSLSAAVWWPWWWWRWLGECASQKQQLMEFTNRSSSCVSILLVANGQKWGWRRTKSRILDLRI